jgi:Domain of unknown function (DUF4360)
MRFSHPTSIVLATFISLYSIACSDAGYSEGGYGDGAKGNEYAQTGRAEDPWGNEVDTCPDYAPDVCDGICRDFISDNDNCGECGRRCGYDSATGMGEGCVGGKCIPYRSIPDDSSVSTIVTFSGNCPEMFAPDVDSQLASVGGMTKMTSIDCVVTFDIQYPAGWSLGISGDSLHAEARLNDSATANLGLESTFLGNRATASPRNLSGPGTQYVSMGVFPSGFTSCGATSVRLENHITGEITGTLDEETGLYVDLLEAAYMWRPCE